MYNSILCSLVDISVVLSEPAGRNGARYVCQSSFELNRKGENCIPLNHQVSKDGKMNVVVNSAFQNALVQLNLS